MPDLISCLMPTYNRYSDPQTGYLVQEAVESFLRQDDKNSELIICNDTPSQVLEFDHPRVKVFNVTERFSTLSDKIQYMIDVSSGNILCRWDDDDISLPHRLSYSRAKLGDRLEWRPENYWFDCGPLRYIEHAGNLHITGLWRRDLLKLFPSGKYPIGRTGDEDQNFNSLVAGSLGYRLGELIPREDMFYLYRWATGGRHLSGVKADGEDGHQSHWNNIGLAQVVPGRFRIEPRWFSNHLVKVQHKLQSYSLPTFGWEDQNGYFDYAKLYDFAVSRSVGRSKLVEVGCLSGRSLLYLGKAAKEAGRRIKVYGVDLGVGENSPPAAIYSSTSSLITIIQKAGLQDTIDLVAAESMEASNLFGDQTLDFVFIDAGHDYNSVRSDMQAWWPKVRSGGIIAGHDVNHPHFPDVKRAVQDFLLECQGQTRDIGPCSLASSCWMIYKP